jgi:secreted PhoX family phosphatase
MDGTSYELPWLGKFAWENSVANPATGITTVVAGTDDGTGGQVYFYVGTKTNSSNPVEAAGLAYGNLFSIKVDGLDAETNSTILNGAVPFTAYNFGDVSSLTGAQLEAASKDGSGAFRVTSFQRPEDGAWDPNNPNDFYFVTTASFTGNSRLWKVHFNDPANPSAGGTIEMLLDGSEGQKMMDNLSINNRGQIIIQEDPGNQPYIAKIWRYDIATDKLVEIARHDPDRFTPGAAGFLTQDEESSGIIDASSILGEGWYLLVQQAHYATDAELVEGGQLLALHIPPGKK